MNADTILPDRELEPELAEHARRVRAFAADKLAPHARRIDEEGVFRRESVGELAAAGILAGPIAREHGGGGWTPLQLAVAHEEIGAVCGNTRGFLAVQCGLVAHALATHASAAQRARWLPRLLDGSAIGCFALTEPDAGSDVAALACRAEARGGGFRLAGEKVWITNGGVADVALVFATLDPSRGREAITAFLVDPTAAGLRRERMPGKELGHRGSDHARLVFDGVEVGRDAIVGAEGQGLEVAMCGLHAGRLSVAAGAVGVLRAALACSAEFVAGRSQFGKPLSRFQMVQERIADMTVDLFAARQLVWRCARLRHTDRENPADLAAAKLFATEAAARAADQAVMLHGGRGYSSAYPAERLLRDIMGLRIYEGTSMVQKSIVARAVW